MMPGSSCMHCVACKLNCWKLWSPEGWVAVQATTEPALKPRQRLWQQLSPVGTLTLLSCT